MKMKRSDYFIEWPEINFDEIKDYAVDNRVANLMYKAVIVMLFMPQILIRAFYEVLRFRV
jgi:hypothetical protein